ncbi:MAG: hypothetical protein HY958_02490 [Bacteroidia bacterium]|nr:hypothetical protein [Bacteroidia bacterium]
MKHVIYIIAFLIPALLLTSSVFGQKDTTKSEMSFDFGITRGKNIDLWPIFKRFRSKERKDIEVLYPLFRYNRNYTNHTKHTNFFPFWWNDSSSVSKDLRIGTLYYPSLIHTSKDRSKGISSFRFIDLAPEINFIEFTKSSDGLFIQNNICFLLWYKNDLALKNSHLIFFPVYWSFKNPERTSNTFIPVFSSGTYHNNQNKYTVVTPLFWHFQEGDDYRNILFPLWWNKKQGSGDNLVKSNVVFPIYWSLKNKDKDNKILFPVVWSLKNCNYNSFTIAPLFSAGHSADGKNSHIMATPLFWLFKKNEEYTNILFPLWWNIKRGSGDNAVFTNVVFPVYWNMKDARYTSVTVPPLFSTGHSTDGNNGHLMVTPLFWHFKEGDGYRNVLFPFWWNKKTGSGEDAVYKNYVFPLYGSYKNRYNSCHILFPVLWHFRDEKYTSLTIAPILSAGHSPDGKKSHLMLSPLFWQFKDGDDYRNILFPVWWNKKESSGDNAVYSNIVFPFYWSYKDKDRDNQVLFPVHWKMKNKKYSSYTFAPLFSTGHSPDSSRTHLMVSPLIWFTKKNDVTRSAVFPLYWTYKDKVKEIKIMLPMFWSIKDTAYTSVTVAPLFSKGHSADNRKSYLMATPLYWHFKDRDGYRNILFPLWWNKKTGDGENERYSNVIFPLYFAFKNRDRDDKVLFPVFWKMKDNYYSSVTLFPLFSTGHSPDDKEKHLTISPLFWHYQNDGNYKNVLFPIWWYKKSGSGENEKYTNVIFPLYWAYKDHDENNRILFPVFWSMKNSKYNSLTVAPIFSTGHSADDTRSHLIVTPLFWHTKEKDGYSNVLFPLWWNQKYGEGENEVRSNVLFPIYWSYKDKNTDNKVVFPVHWRLKNEHYSSYTFFPLFSKGHSPDESESHLVVTPLFWNIKKRDEHNRVLFPLWWYIKRGEGENETCTNVVFPLYWAFKNRNEDNKVLFPVYWNLKNFKYHSVTIFPIFSKGESPDGNKNHVMATPLFWHFKEGDRCDNVLFPIWWNKKQGSGENEISYNVAFPLYWSFKNKDKNNTIFFPVLWKFKNSHYSSFTVPPLFSAGHSADDKNNHLVVTPLFWHFKKDEEYSNILFPIWWNNKWGKGENSIYTNVVFPLYWAYKDLHKNNKVLFPLVWSFKHTRYSSLTILPVFSAGHSPDNSYGHLMITPLFWKIKKPGYQRLVLFPVIDTYSDTAGKSDFNLLYIIFRTSKEKERRTFSFLWPICEFKKDIDYRYFRFAPVIWYEKSKTSQYFSVQPLFYYKKDTVSKNYNILWQLYTTKNFFHIKKSKNILWKVVTLDKYYNNDYEFRILHLLYANINKDGNIERSIFPLYHYTKEKNGNRSLAILFYFYNSFKRQITDTDEFYQEVRIFWFVRLKSNYKVLKAKGINENLIKQ